MSTKKDHRNHEHVITNKTKLIERIKKLKGQLEGAQKALEGDKDCKQILHLLSSIRGALGGLMAEVMESHIIEHMGAEKKGLSEKEIYMAHELVDYIKVFLK